MYLEKTVIFEIKQYTSRQCMGQIGSIKGNVKPFWNVWILKYNTPKLWDIGKSVIRENFRALNVYIRKKKDLKSLI